MRTTIVNTSNPSVIRRTMKALGIWDIWKTKPTDLCNIVDKIPYQGIAVGSIYDNGNGIIAMNAMDTKCRHIVKIIDKNRHETLSFIIHGAGTYDAFLSMIDEPVPDEKVLAYV